MPFTRRPDSFLVLSGPKPASRTGNTAADIDSLSGFVSEVQPPAVVAPVVAAPAVALQWWPLRWSCSGRGFAGTPCCGRQRRYNVGRTAPTVWKTANAGRGRRRGVHRNRSRLRYRRHYHCARRLRPAINQRGVNRVPSTNVPPTSQAVTPKAPPPTLTGPALPPDPRWAVNAVTPDPPPQSSPVAATANRAVGTTGRRTAVPNQATKTSRAAASSYRGSLAIRSAPQGARVFVNGALVGSTPLELDNLPVGSRAVRIEADGYQRWSASTRVVANQQTRLSATLARAKP